MNFLGEILLVILGLVAGNLCCLEVGRWFGARRRALDPEGVKAGAGAVEAAVFGLMGLLIAFTFSGAAARFETRRALAIQEVNCIGTAWQRLELLPAAAQAPLREQFRQYVAARVAFFRQLPNLGAARLQQARAGAVQTQIWTQTLGACRDSGSSSTALLVLPALNEMFDIASTRNADVQLHPPLLIYAVLVLLVLVGSLLTGYGLGAGKLRDWFHALLFVLALSLAIYVILDFEFPRRGLIRLDRIDQLLVDLQRSMNP